MDTLVFLAWAIVGAGSLVVLNILNGKRARPITPGGIVVAALFAPIVALVAIVRTAAVVANLIVERVRNG